MSKEHDVQNILLNLAQFDIFQCQSNFSFSILILTHRGTQTRSPPIYNKDVLKNFVSFCYIFAKSFPIPTKMCSCLILFNHVLTIFNLSQPWSSSLNLLQPQSTLLNLNQAYPTFLICDHPSSTSCNLAQPHATMLNLA